MQIKIEQTITECKERGIKAVNLGDRIIQYALAKFDRNLRCYTTDSVVGVPDFVRFSCKKKAIEFARSIGWPAQAVEKFGQRHNIQWGVREGATSLFFVASHDLMPAASQG